MSARFIQTIAIAALCGVAPLCSPLRADETNLQATVDGLLHSFGPVPVTKVVAAHTKRKNLLEWADYCSTDHRIKLDPDLWTAATQACESDGDGHVRISDDEILSASNISIISNTPVVFSGLKETGLPNDIHESGGTWVNCSNSVSVSETKDLSIAFTRSTSVEVNHSVSTAKQYQIGGELSIKAVKINAQFQLTNTTTDGQANTTGSDQTVTQTASVSANVPPRTEMGVVIVTWPIIYTTNISATVTADADLSQNDKGLKLLSDIIPLSQRTFPINGTLSFTDAAGAKTRTYDIPLDPNDCSASTTPFNRLVHLPLKDKNGHLVVIKLPPERPNK